MKRTISIVLILVVIMSLVSCRRVNDDLSSNVSTVDNIENFTPQNSTQSEIQLPPQSQNEETAYQSTVDTPKEVVFYKGSKFGISTDEKLNLDVAKCVESWYKNYESNTLPLTKTAITEEMIAQLKYNETVVEICFDYDKKINLCGTIELENTTRLLIPMTGSQAYYVFRGNDAYKYQNGLHAVDGSGLEKYFDGITLDKNVQDWQSTVIAPQTITFYKDGMQSVSTDKEFNQEIAQHIESWFKYVTMCMSFSGITYTEDITSQKQNSTAIELEFDTNFNFYGDYITKGTRKIFISLDGEHPYTLFTNNRYSGTWGNMSPETKYQSKNLEQFFANRSFEDMQPINKWESTVCAPMKVQLYKDGGLIQEFKDKEFNYKIAKHIESWYIYKENLEFENIGITDNTINNIRQNETYIEVFFNSEIKFYGKHILTEDTCSLLIPLTGDFAYFMFASNHDNNYDKYNFSENSNSLELFFDALK